MELADELVNHIGESGAKVANDAAPVTLPSVEAHVVSLSDILEKAREEAVGANTGLKALRAATEFTIVEHNVALAKVQEERQDGLEA